MPAFNATLQLYEPALVVQARVDAAVRSATSRPAERRIGLAHDIKVNSQPGSIVVIRRYTPGWAIVAAILGLVFFLLGLLFLLVKKTQSLTISISSRGEGSCTVMVAGEAQESVISSVQAALAGTAATSPSRGSRSQVVQDAKLGKLNK